MADTARRAVPCDACRRCPGVRDTGRPHRRAGSRAGRAGVIDFENVSVRYPGASEPVLRDVTVHIPEGELCVVVGSTGSGKSTLLGAVNGLVPHFTGGRLSGRVRVDGRDTRTHPPRELADVVGVVGQNPAATFVADTVEDELAYTMESLGVPADVMRRRVEDTLDLLGLVDLRGASGVDAVRRAGPASRDRRGAHCASTRARARRTDLGARPGRGRGRARRGPTSRPRPRPHGADGRTPARTRRAACRFAVWLPGDGSAIRDEPAAIMQRTTSTPPVVTLARAVGWTPPPLTVRDARGAGQVVARTPARRSRSLSQARRWVPRRAYGQTDRALRLARRAARRLAHRALRRDHRADGPQRRREVDAARRTVRAGGAGVRHRARR